MASKKRIEKSPDSKKNKELNRWVKEDLNQRFKNRVLSINMEEMKKWGDILATAEKNGKPLPAIDSLIAATAQVHDLVTRNTQEMEVSKRKIRISSIGTASGFCEISRNVRVPGI